MIIRATARFTDIPGDRGVLVIMKARADGGIRLLVASRS
jgi:hypothetical protein